MTIRNAMVLAAGLGSRLRPITETTPKPLVKIAGKSMVDTALDLLVEAGVTRAVVNVHHLADQMEAHLAGRKTPDILISDERDMLLDSGGGLKKGLGLLNDDPLFVMNSDLFWINEGHTSNLRQLGDRFDPDTMDMLLLCVTLENTTGHNGKRDFSCAEDGRLTRYREGAPNPVVYAGAFIMLPALLNDAPDGAFSLNAYFDKAIAKGRLFGMTLQGHWITVGTPEAIAEAETVLQNLAQ